MLNTPAANPLITRPIINVGIVSIIDKPDPIPINALSKNIALRLPLLISGPPNTLPIRRPNRPALPISV